MPIKSRSYLAVFVLSSLAMLLSACHQGQKGPAIQEGDKVDGAAINVVNLDQSWTVDTQQAFYFTDQGSRIMPYSWFLALENADSQTLLRSDETINRYRYLPSKPSSSWNPDGLPVGFVKNIDSKTKDEWVGMTCAACHTGQIRYKTVEMRIDGGPTLADFEGFNDALVAAMSATYQQQDKFDRFAAAVLGSGATPNQVSTLRQNLLQETEKLEQRNLVNRPTEDQPRYGFSRLDAIGAIFNQILADFNGLPNAGVASDAPVSYPFLWGTHQADVVQWPGFAPNGPASLGALIRNGGEVLGVYGQLNVPDNPQVKHYPSSLSIVNLGKLEKWVAELRSPAWPAEYLPPIDPILSAKGALHFDKHCVSCHQVVPRKDEGKSYKSVLTPQTEVATDSRELDNMFLLRPAGKFAGRKEFVLGGPVIGEQTSGLEPLVNAVVGSLLQHPLDTLKAAAIQEAGSIIAASPNDGISTTEGVQDPNTPQIPEKLKQSLDGFSFSPPEQVTTEQPNITNSESPATPPAGGKVYKARPLNGIWATAPYLHNGSVPNLYELLLPAAERSKEFYLGSRDYDPVKVGYDSSISSQNPNAFKLDTSLVGNTNVGHEYGATELNEAQRKELLEYLKSL